jgi:hypothetical protein
MNKPIEWTSHLPALALLGAMLGVLWLGSPWPEPVANGFDAQGRAVTSNWPPAMLGGAVVLWLVWFAVEGLWQGLERKRRVFNPLALVDEGVVGWMLVRLADAGATGEMAAGAGVAARLAVVFAVGAAAVLEVRRLRKPVAEEQPRAAEDAAALSDELSEIRRSGRRWSYWSVQQPPHRLLFGALGVSFVAGGIAIAGGPAFARLLLLVAGALVLMVCTGGLRTVVTPGRLVLRAGHFGPRLVRVDTSDIVAVAVPDFDPVRDFGGWGIKRGISGPLVGVWAFNLADAGVLIETRAGKRYLIGTDEPERFAAALNAARGKT